MIELQTHRRGVLLAVRAQPNARTNSIRGEHGGALKVAITQSPEKGKANQAIIAVLASHLRIRKSQIELIGGATTANKRIVIGEIAIDELADRIRQVIADLA